jgi:tetratricopeptide (TPR) repeat protein
MYPELASAHTNIGLAYNRLGQPDEAIEHLKTAIAIDPSRSAPWVNLATSFQTTGQLKNCIATYNEFIRRFPNDSNATFAIALLKNLQKEASEQDEVEHAIASSHQSGNSDYFPFTTVKGTVKWDASRIPVKVSIGSGSGVKGYKPEFHGIMADAFKSWSSASQDKISFDFVKDASKADIECIWTTDYSLVGSVAEGGEAQTQYSPQGIQHVRIVILTADPTPDSPLTQNQLQAVCLHEIGHSLGLIGHSPKPGDIMFCSMPSAEAKVSLSARDVGTIRHLYTSDVQIAVLPHGASAKSENGADKAAINNEGIELMTSHAYAQAIEKFETALKLDPNYETAKVNLNSAYNNYAVELMNKGKEQEAESLMQKAMKLQSSLRSAAVKLKLATMHNYALCLRKLHREGEAAKVDADAALLEQKEASR